MFTATSIGKDGPPDWAKVWTAGVNDHSIKFPGFGESPVSAEKHAGFGDFDCFCFDKSPVEVSEGESESDPNIMFSLCQLPVLRY